MLNTQNICAFHSSAITLAKGKSLQAKLHKYIIFYL